MQFFFYYFHVDTFTNRIGKDFSVRGTDCQHFTEFSTEDKTNRWGSSIDRRTNERIGIANARTLQ